MRRLPEVQRLALAISLYIFVTLSLVFGIFFVIYQSLNYGQNLHDFEREMNDIIANHLEIKDGQLQFLKDQEGSSLKQYLTTENMSALFVDAQGKTLRGYGLFALNPLQPEQDLVASWRQSITNRVAPQMVTAEWLGQPIQVFIVPLRRNSTLSAVLVLGRSQSSTLANTKRMVISMGSILLLNIVLSFAVGLLLAKGIVKPVRKISQQIQSIDLDNIEASLPETGHPGDATVLLSIRINDMLQRLKTASQKQKAFVTQASHELKTPLTRVISTLELGIQSPQTLSVKTQEAVQELFRLNELINQLLLMSQLHSRADIRSQKHIINFKKCLDDALKTLSALSDNPLIEIQNNIPSEVRVAVSATYVRVIIQNLVQNAIKFTQKNGKISISLTQHEGSICLEVKDTGVGMSPDEVQRATQTFYRSKTAQQRVAGYGIGLSLVKQICDTYGEKLTIESEPNQGTTVTVLFLT